MKKKLILTAVALVAIAVTSYEVYQHWLFVETDNAQIEAHSVLLSAKIQGFIKDVPVAEGQRVKKNQVLVQIDPRDYESSLDGAKSELLSLEARKQDAEKNYHRIKDLFKKNVLPQQQYDTALASHNEVRARYDATNARLTQAKLNVEYTQIKAPSDGIIAKTSAEVGQLASPGVPLVGFVSSESRWVVANFKETEVEQVKIGGKVDLEIDALSHQKFTGEVENIYPATGSTFTLLPPDNATGNFTKVVQRVPVKIKIINLKAEDIEKLQSGLSVVAKVRVH